MLKRIIIEWIKRKSKFISFLLFFIGLTVVAYGQEECPTAGGYWSSSNMQVIQDSVTDFRIYPRESSSMLISTTQYLLRSVDCGRSFDTLKTAIKGFKGIYLSEENPNFIITVDTGLIASQNGGESWYAMDQSIDYGDSQHLGSFSVDAMNDSVIYIGTVGAGTKNIYKSVDRGETWSELISDSDSVFSNEVNLTDLASFNNKVIAGDDSTGRLYASMDGGSSWQNLKVLDKINKVGLVGVKWSYSYFSKQGDLFYVYESDNQDSLIVRGPVTPDSLKSINSFEDTDCAEFIATSSGIYRRITCVFKEHAANDSEYRYDNNDSLSSKNTVALEISHNNDYMFTIAKSDSVYNLYIKEGPTIGSISDVEVSKKIELSNNYPNPFNPSTNIKFKLPHSADVTLTVYNTIGQKVETLVERPMSAGAHSIKFEAGGLPSGVYIYRLKADGLTQSKKMLLIK